MQEPSIFSRIINGEIPCHKVYEDDRVIAFLDVHPVAKGHTLVVPKKQIDHIWDLEDDDYQYLWMTSKKIAKNLKEKLNVNRVGVIVEGFGVPHAHIHLMPINNSEEIRKLPNADAEIDHAALSEVAAAIKI
jgi:histidine triad (HIT) family protein